jgi:hypothetical protein
MYIQQLEVKVPPRNQNTVAVCTIEVSVQVRGLVCEYFVTKIRFHSEELLALCPNPKLDNHPLSAARNCLFNKFAATLHIASVPPSATPGRSMLW